MINPDDTKRAMKARKKVKETRNPLADWRNPEDHSFYVLERYHEDRNKYLPDDRKCPQCDELIAESSRWVVSRKGSCMCRACFQRLSNLETPPDMPVLKDAFEEQPRFEVNSSILADNLSSLGISQREFARRLGYSQSYVNKLLNSQIPSIAGDYYDNIQSVFNARLSEIRESIK